MRKKNKNEEPEFELIANKVQNKNTGKTVAVHDSLVVRIIDPEYKDHQHEFEKLCGVKPTKNGGKNA